MSNTQFQVRINDQIMDAASNQTVFQLALSQHIDIPHLCHEDSLSREGECELCFVQDQRTGRMLKACSTPIENDMDLVTESAELARHRQSTLNRILKNHPVECPECPKDGLCLLQKYGRKYNADFSFEIGETLSPSLESTGASMPSKDQNPFFQRDKQKCAICGSCIRVCADSNGSDIFNADDRIRGIPPKPASVENEQTGRCDHCGACLTVCPTAAILEKGTTSRKKLVVPKKLVDAQGVRTTCPYCGVGCQLQLKVYHGHVVGVGRDNSGSNKGQLCVKGQFGWEFIHHKDRLTQPLIKRNGKLEPASWDEALSLVARRFGELFVRRGGRSLAGFSSAKCTNEENYLFQKFMRTVLGSNHIDHCARLCHSSTVAGLSTAFGSGAMTNSINELLLSDVMLVIGANVTETQPVTGYRIREAAKKGTKLIVVDPRKIELVKHAHLWLRLRPGTNTALLNGLAHVVIRDGLWNRDFVAERSEGFERWRNSLDEYTPERVEELTGVPAANLVEAAHLYAKAKNGSIVYAMGITQHTSGTQNVFAVANLAVLCGHIAREGAGVYPLRGQNNVQGSCDMGALPNYYPGYRHILEEKDRHWFEDFWGVKPLPEWVGKTVPEVFHGIQNKEIHGLYIMGENPILSDPDSTFVERALRNLDFFVVQDIFLTETARLADMVLPAACYAEKDGTFTNTERRVQLVRKTVEPPGQARADWQILTELANRMGHPWHYRHPSEIMEELAKCTPIYGGIRHERLQKRGLQWPCPDMDHPGTPFLHEERFTRGKGKFHDVEHLQPDEIPDEQYPLLLTTGRILYQFHTGSMSRRSGRLEKMAPEEKAMIHPDDATKYGLTDGDRVTVESRRGRVPTAIQVTDGVPRGVVFMTFHYVETPTNRLTNDATDPVCRIPELKECAIRIAKIPDETVHA